MKSTLTILASICLFTTASAQTRVKVDTVYGDIFITLYDTLAPITVANFLAYAERGDYDGSIFHRNLPGFVLQGGGFELTGADSSENIQAIATDDPIVNEFGVSNLRGTIAMAKLGDDPDSATSQWFVNLGDNSANLDVQNGGFTVFGEIEDLSVIDTITTTRTVNLGGAFSNLPIKDLDHPDSSGAQSEAELTREDYVSLDKFTIIPADAVPEPSSSLFIASSAVGFLLRRSRK